MSKDEAISEMNRRDQAGATSSSPRRRRSIREPIRVASTPSPREDLQCRAASDSRNGIRRGTMSRMSASLALVALSAGVFGCAAAREESARGAGSLEAQDYIDIR